MLEVLSPGRNGTPLHFHFLGICGTAMGAVAAMLKEKGHTVSGSDNNVYPPMSTFLEQKGIILSAGYRPENLPESGDVLLVVGNTIKRGNAELEAALDRKQHYLSLPEVLKYYFLQKTHNLVVTGTHGKTTTSSILTWLMEATGHKPSFLIGGIPENLGQGCQQQSGKHWILEGDEYDTAFFDKRSKFLHYLPELLIINNVEFDHADIYENLEAIQLSFRRLVNIVPRNGLILVNADDPNAVAVTKDSLAPIVEVGFSQNAGTKIEEVSYFEDHCEFNLFHHRFSLPMVGEFNVRNAAMAISAAHYYQVPLQDLSTALAGFKGVKRRQEVRGTEKGITVIDDFGHHPTAIRETIRGLRHRYQGRKLWAIFEPRSNTTRRSVFQNSLAEALSEADGVFVAQVAALEQIPVAQRLDPLRVVSDIAGMKIPAYYERDAEAIVEKIGPLLLPQDVVVIFSNGGFGGIHTKLLKSLSGS